MKQFNRLPSIVLLFLLSLKAFGQNYETLETALQNDFEKLYSPNADTILLSLNAKILSEFRDALKMENSFEYPFEKLTRISRRFSKDEKLKIYTWHVQTSDGKFQYFGFIQFQHKKEIRLFELHDNSEQIANPENATLSPKQWYGALYYDIIEKKIKKQTYYTLLAWDGNDNFTNKKLIDVFLVSKEGIPQFGAPIFNFNGFFKQRIIFEYAEQAGMMLRYDSDYKMIIWDHLAPAQKQFEGQYRFYGPDFSYDGLMFKKNTWILMEKINPLNKETPTKNKEIKYGY